MVDLISGTGTSAASQKADYHTMPVPKNTQAVSVEGYFRVLKAWLRQPETIKKYFMLVPQIQWMVEGMDHERMTWCSAGVGTTKVAPHPPEAGPPGRHRT